MEKETAHALKSFMRRIDDIEDGANLRSGIPTAHNIFGVPCAYNSASYVNYLCLETGLKLDHPKALTILIEQILQAHRGQWMDLYWRDNFVCPTEEEYKVMATLKTGPFFEICVQLMQLFSENQSDFSKIVNKIGLFFQISDDYADLISVQDTVQGESPFDDLTEGKFSFPVVHAIQNNPEDQRLMNILRKRTTDVEIKKYAVQLLEEFGSLKHCREAVEKLHQEIRGEIEVLGNNSEMLVILDERKRRKLGKLSCL